ncbi:TlpA disulfide reductase family protein [Hyalangium sp.]|uniref:TlpA family protein disulfide reductase n=1 Tax=Hyalangium sp. TaxID=2028555 RepID=UPI002D4B371B|nr:TlpA disulfide reductase family protein [Hyalangium sp.]HYI01155.1 TlpA disulfide reductase family protein [Hyalangium sp.]
MRTFLGVAGLLALAGCTQNSTLPPLVAGNRAASMAPAADIGEARGALREPLSFQVKRYPDGAAYSVASDRGSVVLLDVWATWCEPCRDALPLYEQLVKEYGSRGFKAYALNVDEDSRTIPAFLKETQVNLPILVDENAQLAEKTLGVKMMPTTFIVDRKGVVRFVHEGFSEAFLQQYQTEIEQLLAERAK